MAWDSCLYTRAQFQSYYGGLIEFDESHQFTLDLVRSLQPLIDKEKNLTQHELRTLTILMDRFAYRQNLVPIPPADEEFLLRVAACVNVPMRCRHNYLLDKSLPRCTLLDKSQGVEVVLRWRRAWEASVPRAERRSARGSNFWAHVDTVVGTTQLAKFLVNQGLFDVVAMSLCLLEFVNEKSSPAYVARVQENSHRRTDRKRMLGEDASWFNRLARRSPVSCIAGDEESRIAEYNAWKRQRANETNESIGRYIADSVRFSL